MAQMQPLRQFYGVDLVKKSGIKVCGISLFITSFGTQDHPS